MGESVATSATWILRCAKLISHPYPRAMPRTSDFVMLVLFLLQISLLSRAQVIPNVASNNDGSLPPITMEEIDSPGPGIISFMPFCNPAIDLQLPDRGTKLAWKNNSSECSRVNLIYDPRYRGDIENCYCEYVANLAPILEGDYEVGYEEGDYRGLTLAYQRRCMWGFFESTAAAMAESNECKIRDLGKLKIWKNVNFDEDVPQYRPGEEVFGYAEKEKSNFTYCHLMHDGQCLTGEWECERKTEK
jgi:hypothetical protein